MKKSTFLHFLMFSFYWFISYNANGQTPNLAFATVLESNHSHGIWSRATVTDTQGNFYVTGLYHGTVDFNPNSTATFLLTYQGGTDNVVGGEADVYVAKYNALGEFVWAKNLIEPTFADMNEERGSAMILDDNNNLYLTGFTTTRGFFVSKWDTDGNEQWTRYFDDTEENNISTFALKKLNNNILVTGMFVGTVDFDPSTTTTNNITSVNGDGFLLSLSNEGNFNWVKQFRCNGFTLLSGLEVDDSNNIFLSGIFLGSVDLNPSATASTIITSNSVSTGAISSAFIAKYSSSGDLIWNRHIRGTAPTDIFMTFIKKDSDNNIIMTGSLKGFASFLPTTTSLSSNDFYTSFLVKYDPNGNLVWTRQFGIPTGTQTSFFTASFTSSLTLDACNTIYVSGEFQGNCDFDPSSEQKTLSTLTNTTDAFLAVYSPEGNHQWSMDIGDTGGPVFVDFSGYLPIALTENNDVIITGSFRGSIDMDPSEGTLLLNSNSGTVPNNAGIFMAKYENPLECSLVTNKFDTTSFIITPNPTKGNFSIQRTNSIAHFDLVVYDLTGKLVFEQFNNKNEFTAIQLPQLSPGVYLAKINTKNDVELIKLIVE